MSFANGNLTIVYTNNNRFDEQSKRRIRAHAGRWSRAHRSGKLTTKQELSTPTSVEKPEGVIDTSVLRSIEEDGPEPPDQSSRPQTTRFPPSAILSNEVVAAPKVDAFQTLPQVSPEKVRPDAFTVAVSHISALLGKEFVRQHITQNAGQSSSMYASSLLMTYARHYALTGKLLGPDMLRLKGEVIKAVKANIRHGLDLESLWAMFVLGTPVVCLTTTSSPSPNATQKWLLADQQAASSLAVEDGLANEIALRDHFLHRQTLMRILVDMGSVELRKAKIGRYFLAFFILMGNFASLISSDTPIFKESDLYPPPGTEVNVKSSPIWHSPLYCPSGMYTGAVTPRNSRESLTVELCQNVQSWLGTFEADYDDTGEECELFHRENYRRRIELFPLQAGASGSESGYIYECCRLTAHLMLRAEALQCSLAEAAQGTTYLVQIDSVLQRTNLSDLWDSRIGLLLWVLLVSCTTVTGRSFNINTTTVLFNFLLGRIAVSDYHIGVGLRPLQKLKWFIDKCAPKQ